MQLRERAASESTRMNTHEHVDERQYNQVYLRAARPPESFGNPNPERNPNNQMKMEKIIQNH